VQSQARASALRSRGHLPQRRRTPAVLRQGDAYGKGPAAAAGAGTVFVRRVEGPHRAYKEKRARPRHAPLLRRPRCRCRALPHCGKPLRSIARARLQRHADVAVTVPQDGDLMASARAPPPVKHWSNARGRQQPGAPSPQRRRPRRVFVRAHTASGAPRLPPPAPPRARGCPPAAQPPARPRTARGSTLPWPRPPAPARMRRVRLVRGEGRGVSD